VEAWPGTLPQTIKADYNIEPRAGMADEDEERNPQRTRTYPEYDATFSVFMNNTQKDEFRAWWDNTLNQSAPFTAPWLDLLGFEFYFLRFTDTPSWKGSGGAYWTVTLPVEIIAGAGNYV
jgi:hypothetical protein